MVSWAKQAGESLKWLEYPTLSVYSSFALMIVFYKPCSECFLSLEFHLFFINIWLWVTMIVLVLLPANYFFVLVLLPASYFVCFSATACKLLCFSATACKLLCFIATACKLLCLFYCYCLQVTLFVLLLLPASYLVCFIATAYKLLCLF
jgi:hypothetical protein